MIEILSSKTFLRKTRSTTVTVICFNTSISALSVISQLVWKLQHNVFCVLFMYTFSDLTFDVHDASDEIRKFITGPAKIMQERVCQEFNDEKMSEK